MRLVAVLLGVFMVASCESWTPPVEEPIISGPVAAKDRKESLVRMGEAPSQLWKVLREKANAK
jgi:hypothetical protein